MRHSARKAAEQDREKAEEKKAQEEKKKAEAEMWSSKECSFSWKNTTSWEGYLWWNFIPALYS